MPQPDTFAEHSDLTETPLHPMEPLPEDVPYKAPLAGGEIGCVFCGTTKLRRSRFVAADVRELLLLRYPVRCARCNQRQHASFLGAAMALPSKSPNSNVARGRDTWQAWTGSETGHPLRRPMSTSVGPKATKLHPLSQRAATHTQAPSQRRDDDREIW